MVVEQQYITYFITLMSWIQIPPPPQVQVIFSRSSYISLVCPLIDAEQFVEKINVHKIVAKTRYKYPTDMPDKNTALFLN